jgi:hypothetical protein
VIVSVWPPFENTMGPEAGPVCRPNTRKLDDVTDEVSSG